MVIATVLIGVVVNGVGVWYSANGSNDPVVQQLSVPAMSDADKIKLIQAELDRLKSVTK